MKLLDRYIAQELAGPFFFGVGAFTSIFIANQLFFKLTGYLAEGAPLADVAGLFVVRLVPMVVFTFPMAMLLAALLTFGRLSSESELTAMLASGIPFLRTAVPVFVAGLLVSGGSLMINELVAPACARTGERLEQQIVAALRAAGASVELPAVRRAFVVQDTDPDGQLARVIIARSFDLATRTLGNVTLVQYGPAPDGGRQVTSVLEAQRAVWIQVVSWRFHNGRLQAVNPPVRQEASSTAGERYNVSGQFDVLDVTIRKTPRQVMAQQRNPEEMNFVELREAIANLKDQGAGRTAVRELKLELYNKLAVPFASTVFALMAPPLGHRRLRGSASVGMGLSVLIIFGYYTLWHGMHALGQGGQVPPVVASWLPNALGLAAALVMNLRAPT
jgi:lipopolysaccharide export system permease protein